LGGFWAKLKKEHNFGFWAKSGKKGKNQGVLQAFFRFLPQNLFLNFQVIKIVITSFHNEQ